MGSLFVMSMFYFLFLLRMPVCISMGIASLIYILCVGDITTMLIPQIMAHGVQNFVLLAIPFFILAGNIMNCGGMTERIFKFASSIIGHARGGLAQVVVVASMIFGGISGSALADAAGLGTVTVKAMDDAGYSRKFGAGLTLAAATMDPIIPPSIMMVIYAFMANASIGRLFFGGILPGVLMGLTLMVQIYYLVTTKRRHCPPDVWKGFPYVVGVFKHSFLAVVAPLVILFGMLGGVVTTTEAGLLATVYCFIVGLIYRELKLKEIPQVLMDTMKQTAVIMFIISTASVISWIITKESVPALLAQLILGITHNRYLVLAIINVFLLIVGCLIETVPAMILTIPVLMPIVDAIGVDRVHFGVILCVNLAIGFAAPPMGIGIYVMAAVAKLTPEDVIKETLPLLIPLLIALVLITYIPEITLCVPNFLFGKG
jgi:tripartite ATP-independent transporter DctM subunit